MPSPRNVCTANCYLQWRLTQARTATAGKKQLNFSVKKKPTDDCILDANFMIKRLRGNCIDCFEVNLK